MKKRKIRRVVTFFVVFAMVFAISILLSMLDLFLHPWVAQAKWTWWHLLSRHGLAIAWNSGVLWPQFILATAFAIMSAVFYDR